ncbi:MAG: hypothetical protein H7246_04415 [Phycisphaerae bacterium]|nr:hypothetical protein [Saprospiraceae bacterium]
MEDNNKIIQDENEKGSLQGILGEGSDDLTATPIQKGVDEDNSQRLSERLSFEGSLSPEQKTEVRSLFKADFEASIEEKKEELKKETQETKKDFLTIFGLFASFVTFLSIEVQVFKNKDNVWELIGVTSISLSFVMFFAIVINDIAKDKNGWSDFIKPIYLINIFFASIGIFCLFMGSKSPGNKMDSLEKKIASDSLEIFYLKNDAIGLRNKIDSLASNIDSLGALITPSQW